MRNSLAGLMTVALLLGAACFRLRPSGARGPGTGRCGRQKGRPRSGHRRVHRGHSPRSPAPGPITAGRMPACSRKIGTAPSATARRRSQLDPNDAQAHLTRGIAFRAKGNPGQAIADLTAAIQVAPTSPDAPDSHGVAFEASIGRGVSTPPGANWTRPSPISRRPSCRNPRSTAATSTAAGLRSKKANSTRPSPT